MNTANSDDSSLLPSDMKHTPTPWAYVKDAPLFGKDRNWGFIKSEAVRACVVGVGEFSRTSYGETETYSGVKIAPHDAAFIIRACNSHAALVEALQDMAERWKLVAPLFNINNGEFNGVRADTSEAIARAALEAAQS